MSKKIYKKVETNIAKVATKSFYVGAPEGRSLNKWNERF